MLSSARQQRRGGAAAWIRSGQERRRMKAQRNVTPTEGGALDDTDMRSSPGERLRFAQWAGREEMSDFARE